MGFTINKVDPCLLHYESAQGRIYCALTVDDALLVYSSYEVLQKLDMAYQVAFGVDGYTTETSDTFMHLGMKITQDIQDGSIEVSQWDFVANLLSQVKPMIVKYGIPRGSTPAAPDIFEESIGSPALGDEDREI